MVLIGSARVKLSSPNRQPRVRHSPDKFHSSRARQVTPKTNDCNQLRPGGFA